MCTHMASVSSCELDLIMHPEFIAYKSSKCTAFEVNGNVFATMRTKTTGYRDLALAVAVPSAFVLLHVFFLGFSFENLQVKIKEAISKFASQSQMTKDEVPLSQKSKISHPLYLKYFKIVASISTLVSGLTFMLNFTLYIRKPIYELRDSQNKVQLTARHLHDRKSISIEFTQRKNGLHNQKTFLMKLEVKTATWEIFLLDKTHPSNLIIMRIPSVWQRDTRFSSVDGLFSFRATSINRYTIRLGDTEIIAPLTNGTERFDMHFEGKSVTPRLVSAFCCYIARTVDTLPLDFLVYLLVLIAVYGAISVNVISKVEELQKVLVDVHETHEAEENRRKENEAENEKWKLIREEQGKKRERLLKVFMKGQPNLRPQRLHLIKTEARHDSFLPFRPP